MKLKLNKKGKLCSIFVVIALISAVIIFYNLNKSLIKFVDNNPKIQINTKFNSKKNIKSVKDGHISDVVINDKKINNSKLGEYPVTYKYQDHSY